MPRSARHTPGGYVYHALNRATARLKLFRKAADYSAFLRVLDEALERHPVRVLSYCVMPTHWHIVLWPAGDGALTAFLRWLTLTHSVRWHKHYHSSGSGHVYQNRFKAFAVAEDDHLLTVLRYVERNPLRAGLVRRAEDWPWSSLACRLAADEVAVRRLHPGPVALPADWLRASTNRFSVSRRGHTLYPRDFVGLQAEIEDCEIDAHVIRVGGPG
jgi:putative transposase